MASVEINLVELADYVHATSGELRQNAMAWGASRGISAKHIEHVLDQIESPSEDSFIAVCHDLASMEIDLEPALPVENFWMIPDSFELPDPEFQFTQFLVSRPALIEHDQIYTSDGELLIPARYGSKPAMTIQHDWHFLVGCNSVMPSICGQVEELEPVSVPQFLDQVHSSSCAGSMLGFGIREASFFLDRLSRLPLLPNLGRQAIETSLLLRENGLNWQ